MLRQKSGVILNTGSISGQVGIPGQGAYGPSKGAVHQLTRQMAVEYAPHGIRVNAVGCGTIEEMRTKPQFVKITGAGQRESHVHDVQITKEPPNYRAG